MTISRHSYNDEEITSYYIGGGINTIDGKTLGQYTGLTDKNDKKIFERDIVRWIWDDKQFIAEVVFHNGGFCMEVETHNGTAYICLQASDLWEHEVIGNIHDNPELLKGGAE